MKSQIRLRVFLPLLAVAIGGLAAFQLGLLDRVGLGPGETGTVAASALGGAQGEPEADAATTEVPAPATGETAPAGTAPEETAPEEVAPAEAAPADTGSAGEPATGSATGGLAELESALEQHKVVVLVVYTPKSSVDALVAQEARLATEDVGVGFVSVNAAKEQQVADLALAYDLRVTPTVFVFRHGPTLLNRFAGFADRATIAQAAATAKRPA